MSVVTLVARAYDERPLLASMCVSCQYFGFRAKRNMGVGAKTKNIIVNKLIKKLVLFIPCLPFYRIFLPSHCILTNYLSCRALKRNGSRR